MGRTVADMLQLQEFTFNIIKLLLLFYSIDRLMIVT